MGLILFTRPRSWRIVRGICTGRLFHCPVLRGDRGSVIGNSLYTSARHVRWRGGGMVVACHRQDQTRQLEDTWPVGCSCIYMYQLATQLDSQMRQLLSSILCIPVCC